jgi:hypothetical protein
MKKFLKIILMITALAAGPHYVATANSENSVFLSALGGSVLVYGSVVTFATSAELMVTGIKASGKTVQVSVQSTADASKAVLNVSGKIAKDASLATGKLLKVTALSTGYLLTTAGKVVAFIPNELGKALTAAASDEEKKK